MIKYNGATYIKTNILKNNVRVGWEDNPQEELGDVPPTQEEMYEHYVVSDARGGGYYVTYEGKQLGKFDEEREALIAIKTNMKREDYWPNIYRVNDHGNVDQLDHAGEIIQSWV